MRTSDPLRAEYEALLASEGFRPRQPLTEARRRAFEAALSKEEVAFLGGRARIQEASKTGLLDHITGELLRTLDSADISLPGPVLIEEFPLALFNAQAGAARNGTLILINNGFSVIIYEVCKIYGMSIVPAERRNGEKFPTPAFTDHDRRRMDAAKTALTSTVLAYILDGDARRGTRIPLDVDRSAGMAWRLTTATDLFVVAHELAHLIEGHLGTSAEREAHEWLNRTRAQEFQADQTGALLCLRSLQRPDDMLEIQFAIAGPLVFFAVDHLITRVRNEVDDVPQDLRLADHPTSDERGAALRKLFESLYGTSSLSVADACVQWISWQEDNIVATARRVVQD